MKLDVGKVYVVSSQDGCDICMPDGTQMVHVPAGEARLFVPQTSDTVVYGEAVMTPVRGGKEMLLGEMQAKAQAWVQDLRAELAALLDGAQFVVYWQASQNKLIVHTDRISDDKLETINTLLEKVIPQNIEVVQYNHHIEVSWRDINKYAECVNAIALKAVNPDYENDLTSDKSWVYPCHRKEYWNWFFGNQTIKHLYVEAPFATRISGIAGSAQLETAHIYAPNLLRAEDMFSYNRTLVKVTGYMPNLDYGYDFVESTGLEEWSIPLPKLTDAPAFFWKCYKLKRMLVGFPNLKKADGLFYGTILDKESTLRVLSSIPSWTDGESHPITMGIHVDHQQDEEVLAAIANAEAKGWTLTVQWNSTATSAASVMRFGQLIYAKVSEHELPDGTTDRVLDWGHYVTDETGYETFRSLESAYEYFGLEPPAEQNDEILTTE